MASANETSDRTINEVESDKRAAQCRPQVDKDEPLEQDDRSKNSNEAEQRVDGGGDDDDVGGSGCHDNRRNRGDGRWNYGGQSGRGRSGWGYSRPPRGGYHTQRSLEEDRCYEDSGPQRGRGHSRSHQRPRGAKFLTVSAASSNRDVQMADGNNLLIKVELSQANTNTASGLSHQQKHHHYHHHHNQSHSQRTSNSEKETDSFSRQDQTPQDWDNRYSPSAHKEEGRGGMRDHRYNSPRGYDNRRRGFRPPRRGGRWQGGFGPGVDIRSNNGAFARGGHEPYRHLGGYRGPRNGRVFRRGGQGRGQGQRPGEGSNQTPKSPGENLSAENVDRYQEEVVEGEKSSNGLNDGGDDVHGDEDDDNDYNDDADYREIYHEAEDALKDAGGDSSCGVNSAFGNEEEKSPRGSQVSSAAGGVGMADKHGVTNESSAINLDSNVQSGGQDGTKTLSVPPSDLTSSAPDTVAKVASTTDLPEVEGQGHVKSKTIQSVDVKPSSNECGGEWNDAETRSREAEHSADGSSSGLN